MRNVKMTLDKGLLTIVVDTTADFGPSASGKSVLVASTGGNVLIGDESGCKLGLNVYKANPEYVKPAKK